MMAPLGPHSHIKHYLFSTLLPEVALNPSRPCPSSCLLSWSCGGQECLDGWLLVVPRDTVDLVEHLLFSILLPEVALNPSKPVKTAPVPMPSQLESWRTGVS